LAHTTTAITERARAQYEDDQLELIRHTVASECNDGELAMFLEVCARYELDPFSKQIWAIKIKGRVQIIVSRDGMLALANRSKDFRGCKSFEIREHDLFEVTEDEDGHCHVTHRWRDAEGNPTHGGRDGSRRGEIVGGFAYVRRDGHIDVQFMAYAEQYDKREHTWASHPSAMIVKAAEQNCLRKAFSISGVIGEDEVPEREVVRLTQPGSPAQIDWGEDQALAVDLQQAFEIAGYTRAKVRTIMRGCESEDDRRKVLADLKAEIEEAEVVEAEVVADPPTAA
jgi:phage recombination protein Bet